MILFFFLCICHLRVFILPQKTHSLIVIHKTVTSFNCNVWDCTEFLIHHFLNRLEKQAKILAKVRPCYYYQLLLIKCCRNKVKTVKLHGDSPLPTNFRTLLAEECGYYWYVPHHHRYCVHTQFSSQLALALLTSSIYRQISIVFARFMHRKAVIIALHTYFNTQF